MAVSIIMLAVYLHCLCKHSAYYLTALPLNRRHTDVEHTCQKHDIISENKPYNLCLCTFTLLNFKGFLNQQMAASVKDHIALQSWQLVQEQSLKVNWQENQDSSMVERHARDLEVQVRVPVQVQEQSLKVNWQENQDSSLVERQATDLEVQVRVPVQVEIFLHKLRNTNFMIFLPLPPLSQEVTFLRPPPTVTSHILQNLHLEIIKLKQPLRNYCAK